MTVHMSQAVDGQVGGRGRGAELVAEPVARLRRGRLCGSVAAHSVNGEALGTHLMPHVPSR